MDSSSLIPRPEEILAMRDGVIQQMQFARTYTLGLLESVPDDKWGVFPGDFKSHFAWQVGHLAVAQYGLMLFRQRGRSEGDMELMPGWLRKKFGRGSEPSMEEVPDRYELMLQLSTIHLRSIELVSTLTVETLAEPTEMPYAGFPIKLGALLFCPIHESIHAGQIGVLRRLHGLDPVR